mmetsp:Transcript_17406/g.39789  ORF Transcript_17406/g.39789 Transcript_17406/m.39789 type:complete len:212 (+) Transcript_17406:383-1018(+)
MKQIGSTHLLDVGSTSASAARWHATAGHPPGHAPRHAAHAAVAAALRVHRRHDGRADALDLLALVLELLLLGELVALEPRERIVDRLLRLGLVVLRDLVLHLFVAKRVLHRVAIVLERILRLHLVLEIGVFLGVLLGVGRHLLDVLRSQIRTSDQLGDAQNGMGTHRGGSRVSKKKTGGVCVHVRARVRVRMRGVRVRIRRPPWRGATCRW